MGTILGLNRQFSSLSNGKDGGMSEQAESHGIGFPWRYFEDIKTLVPHLHLCGNHWLSYSRSQRLEDSTTMHRMSSKTHVRQSFLLWIADTMFWISCDLRHKSQTRASPPSNLQFTIPPIKHNAFWVASISTNWLIKNIQPMSLPK